MKSDALTTDVITDEHSFYISSLREEIEYPREENRAKKLIIKQLTEIKTTVNPTNTLVTYNENSIDKTTQNSDNLIEKTIQNNSKEPFKNQKNKHVGGLQKEKTNRKRRKKIITERLHIETTRTEIIRIKPMFIFLATASLKN